MKTCPFCKEADLQDEATVCKHCRKDISEAEKPFYHRQINFLPILIVISLVVGIVFPPFFLVAGFLAIINAVSKKK